MRRRAGSDPRGSDLSTILRPVSVFALLCLVPLASLTYLTIHLADRAVVGEVNARLRTTSSVTGVLVQEQMQGVAELTASYANRPLLIDDLGDGRPARFDNRAIDLHLAQLRSARPGIAGAFFTDTHCRLTQVSPSTPEIVGVDFSYRDWCQGVKSTGDSYVSSAYETAIAGHPLVVAAASIVRGNSGKDLGKPLGIIGAVYTLDAIRSFAHEVAQVQGIDLTITDQHGTVLVGPTKTVTEQGLGSAAGDPQVRDALAGRSGITRSAVAHQDTLAAYAPVHAIGWTVVAAVPASVALARIKHLDSTVLTVAGLLGLVLLAGIGLLGRTLQLRRKAEREVADREAHTRAILEAAADAFISIDSGGVLRAWNRRAEEIFGWSEAEAIGRRLSDTIIPARGLAEHEARRARFLAADGPGSSGPIEITALHRDGHEFPAELTMWVVGSQGSWSLNEVIRDITNRKQAEENLADARDDALESSRLKSEFLANMSHEIRTPMNGVLGMTSLLLDSDLSIEQREFAQTVQTSGEALMGILNDILDFSKIEAGRLDLECIDFDIRRLAEDVVSLLSSRAHEKGLEMACSLPDTMPMMVRGDPGRLRQVLTNLVSNAVKFTSSGEVLVEMKTEMDAGGGVSVRFTVTDTGIGIAVGDREGLFKSFTQADAATTRRYGGTGLGLAICHQLVELMGGEIGVESEPRKGSSFWFTLPLEKGRALERPARRPSLADMRMLVVDDNATNRAILTRFLHAWGIRVQSVDDAIQAHEALVASAAKGEPFDAALLDLNMPDVDGIELARAIRANRDLPPLRLMLLTSSGLHGGAEQAREAGIDAYLTKPVRQSLLFDCLVTVLDTPVDAPLPGKSPERLHSKGSHGVGQILVAEDNSVNQRVVTAMLENLGYQVDVVGDGAEAVAAAMSTPYQAILMDCQMPVLDGYQATSEIRRLQATSRRTPIIAVTASAMKSDQERCEVAGMDDYVSKPIGLKSLAATLARWAPHSADGPSTGASTAATGETELAPGTVAAVTGETEFGPGPVDPAPASSSSAPPVEEKAVLDRQVVARIEMLGKASGEDLMGQLASLFLVDAEARMNALRKAVAANDATGMGASAHTLSGASANLGATDLARLCANLATDGAAGNLEGGAAKIEAVEAELGRVRLALGSSGEAS